VSDDTPTSPRLYAGALLYGLAALTLVAIVAALIFLVNLGGNGEQQRKQLLNQGRQITNLSTLLAECTIPPEERTPPVELKVGARDCYQRSIDARAQDVGLIGDISVIAAACGAANPGDIPATRLCVKAIVDDETKATP